MNDELVHQLDKMDTMIVRAVYAILSIHDDGSQWIAGAVKIFMDHTTAKYGSKLG